MTVPTLTKQTQIVKRADRDVFLETYSNGWSAKRTVHDDGEEYVELMKVDGDDLAIVTRGGTVTLSSTFSGDLPPFRVQFNHSSFGGDRSGLLADVIAELDVLWRYVQRFEERAQALNKAALVG